MVSGREVCPCGEAIEKITHFELDAQEWFEFDHGLVVHRFEKDEDGTIKLGHPAPRVDGA